MAKKLCTEDVPYYFSRTSVKFQGHAGHKIFDFDPNWAFLDCSSRLISLISMKLCTKLQVASVNIKMRANRIFTRFHLWVHKPCVKQSPAPSYVWNQCWKGVKVGPNLLIHPFVPLSILCWTITFPERKLEWLSSDLNEIWYKLLLSKCCSVWVLYICILLFHLLPIFSHELIEAEWRIYSSVN